MKKELQNALQFIIISLLLFSLLYILPENAIPWKALESVTAYSTIGVLNSISRGYSITEQVNTIYIQGGAHTVAIIPLCTGYLEIAVLLAFIFASEDRSLKYRVKGAIGAIIFTFIANIARISGTILASNSLTVEEIDLLHNAGFKILLFLVVAGYYACWYVLVPKLLSTYKNRSLR